MALLQNEDFAIWYLRTSYLANVKDGIGERLINVNNSILNTPGFRAAGWSADPVQRTHSPPIPTTGASEYFRNSNALQREISLEDDEDEGGLVTGRTSNDTIGPGLNAKRRRRREPLEDDDSSDLSDESDDAEGAQRAAQQIRFAKMPSRDRSGSSPLAHPDPDQPDVMVTSPSQPTEGRRRTGSLSAVEAVKARARANTATSSDLSSENELDPAYFQRRLVNSKSAPKSVLSGDVPEKQLVEMSGEQDDSDGDSLGSDLSSDLGETVDSTSVLNAVEGTVSPSSSPIMMAGISSIESRNGKTNSPKRTRTLPTLQPLPPPRPISFVPPVSLLSQALTSQRKAPENPVQGFAKLSGKGSPNPLWIKIYVPSSEDAEEPFEMPLAKTSRDGRPVIVGEAIGLALWRYYEEKLQPPIEPKRLNVNNWTFRMVEDGEVDYDFPALGRTRPITDFTSNNNRGARARSRERPFDEFALVEASPQQLIANNKETPQFIHVEKEETPVPTPQLEAATTPNMVNSRAPSRSNVLLAGQPFTSALSNTSLTPADQPAKAASAATPRLGLLKTIRVRHFDIDVAARVTTLEMSADSYIAEILDHVCKKWNFDKGFYVLKVTGTNTVAPLDRTVEALGTRSDLELVRRRFGAGPTMLTGSPGSASPSAPLLLDIQGPTKKGKKGQTNLQAMAQKQDMISSASNFKKYYVTRKQLTSFTQTSQRVLIFDGDFLHVMPADTAKASNAKASSIAFSAIQRCKVSSKHSKIIRLVVQRVNESKRYDFEARSGGEAQEIVDEVNRETRLAKGSA